VFLGIALLLAFLFPGQSPGGVAAESTRVALTETVQQATAQRATASAPATESPAFATADVAIGATAEPQGGYPAPESETDGEPTAPTEDFSEATRTPTNQGLFEQTKLPAQTEIPTFSPNRPAQTGSTPGGSVAQTTAYPGPATPTVVDEELELTPLLDETPTATATAQPAVVAAAPTATSTQRPPRATTQPAGGADAATPRPRTPTATPAPSAPPVDVIRGNVRWTAAQSPILVRRDLHLAPGATLIIEPGVEVRLAPAVSFFVEGTLYALGTPDQRIRFVGSEGQRWEGIFGRPGSNIALEHTEIRGGGNGGTVLTSEGGNLVLHNAHVNENGGHIQVNDSRLEMRDSEIAGNDMPYGSALEATYGGGGFVILTGNRIGGNRLQPGTAPARISNQSTFDTLNLDIQGNLLVGTQGPDLTLFTNGPIQGGLTCNALVGGTNGLSLRSETPQVPGFALNVRDNALEKHTPPIIPEYLTYGIGRGATSEIALDMRNNWWGNPLGPYEPDRHADGRGEAVGDNIEFSPWQDTRPACAPSQ
jgi:hypothetical protein